MCELCDSDSEDYVYIDGLKVCSECQSELICSACNGSGEGIREGSKCPVCLGSGKARIKESIL